MSELCVNLLCPARLEEKLLDSLLVFPGISLFTSTPTAAHGMSHERMSASEQVMGRSFVTLVQVLLPAQGKAALLSCLQEQFAGAGLRYWVSPVIEAGEIV
ncbi:DUF3240 family protein [Undibacterium sp. Di26W]|uniref:DUF3240 family protein n=1 Tax=Undibacterium sp. Di26W TaxID=3413035 RepID=UPI003BF1B793